MMCKKDANVSHCVLASDNGVVPASRDAGSVSFCLPKYREREVCGAMRVVSFNCNGKRRLREFLERGAGNAHVICVQEHKVIEERFDVWKRSVSSRGFVLASYAAHV